MWSIHQNEPLPAMHHPLLISGLPGVGNVGKIAVDYMLHELRAKPILSFCSDELPASVFVNDRNLIELPTIHISYAKRKHDLLFLHGDIQPLESQASFAFCNCLLDWCQEQQVQEIITTGGIGMKEPPENPQLYVTAVQKAYLTQYSAKKTIYGQVGPIMGISGVLAALAAKRSIPAVVLLAQTYNHPLYFGISSAKKMLGQITKRCDETLNLRKIDKEIRTIEQEMRKKMQEMHNVSAQTNYIG